jgi:L,D-transpeptidase ErfK/SrfK
VQSQQSHYQNPPRYSNRFITGVMAIVGLILVFAVSNVQATVLQLPTNGDTIVGQYQQAVLSESDTFVDVARLYDAGFNELIAANPTVDPWLPGEGTQIIIPTQYVLPNVPWEGIVVNIAEMRMYYFPKADKSQTPLVYTFPIGIGRENWETPLGNFKVVEKMEHPVWTVPQSVLEEARKEGRQMPGVVPPGPDNPLGDHALMLDAPGYLIHGTNKPLTIGRRVSHGCMRMYPEDVEQLIHRVPRGVPVRIINNPIKVGRKNNVLYVEIHPPLKKVKNGEMELRTNAVAAIEDFAGNGLSHETWKRVFAVATHLSGVPVPVADLSKNSSDTHWILRVESSNNGDAQESLVERFKEMALPVFNSRCHPFQTCIDLGLFNSTKLRDATAEFIKHGFGLHSSNLFQNAKANDNEF